MMALLADLLLVVHAAFISFVLVGLVVVVVGGMLGWDWVHHPWFRLAHVAAIAYVVIQSWFGLECPLTTWETQLRLAAGQQPYSDNGFIADWLHRLFFFQAPPWVFVLAYSLFGGLVLATLVLVPIRWRPRSRAAVHPA